MALARIACVDLPALPLQLLLRHHPTWRSGPVVVVDTDRPQGIVAWANVHARRHRILPGMTFAAAQSLAAHLQAAVVPPQDIARCVEELHHALVQFSPHVEPALHEPGVFWIDPSGLIPLYGSLEEWAQGIHTALVGRGFQACVVVGFHRFRSYALARCGVGPGHRTGTFAWVLPNPHTESRWSAKVPLAQLGIDPQLRDQLAVLGVVSLGQFLRLPVSELRARFGETAARLHHAASDDWAPLQPRPLEDPVTGELQLEPPDADHTRLLFGLKGLLHRLLHPLAERSQALRLLHLELELDHAPRHHEYIEPARPTLDATMILELVRLRLAALSLPAAVAAVHLELEGVLTDSEQLALFRTRQRRDLEAAGRALARLRAALGPEAVTRARLKPAHLPEASFEWEPILEARFPHPAPNVQAPLCRRFFSRPIPLPPRPRHEPEAWLGRASPVARLHGPHRISGGWWVRTVERDYYYAETKNGEILWIYYDRPRRRWFLQGVVD